MHVAKYTPLYAVLERLTSNFIFNASYILLNIPMDFFLPYLIICSFIIFADLGVLKPTLFTLLYKDEQDA